MNFPSSPTLNQTYTFEGKTWKWNGQGWQLVPSSSFPWSGLTGVPAEFPPEAHAHEISDVTGLQTALNGKAASSHSHAISDVTGLQTALDGKAASSHSHAISNVTGLQSALDGKQPVGSYEASGTAASAVSAHELASDPHPQYTSAAEAAAAAPVQSVAGRTGAVTLAKADVGLGNVDNTSDANKPISTATQSALDGKAAATHWHDQTDITGLAGTLSSKAEAVHSHAIGDVTGLQTALDGKAPSASPTLTGAIETNGSVRGNVVAVGAGTTIDCATGNYFTKSMSAAWTPTISNVPSGAFGFVIELAWTAGALTLPGGWAWAGGVAPTLSSGTWVLTWVTSDGGTSGLVVAQKRGT